MLRNLLILLMLFNFLNAKVCIKNFDKQLCGDFELLPSVIVKSKLSKEELSKKINNSIKQIAFLENSNLFLVEASNSLEYSKLLSKKKFVIYAQANILQKKIRNSFNFITEQTQFNIENIWKKTKGENVNIAIIDDGFDLEHEDLKDVNLLFSYDSDNKNLTSNPKLKIDNHGTQVAGVIFAQHNGIGVNGIAPKSNLIAIRQTTNITSDTIISFTVAQKAKAHIINCSWNSPYLLEPIYDVIKSLSKNTAIVFAAGNENKKLDLYSIEAAIPEVITIGTYKRYSNYGEIVDFILPTNIKTTKVGNNYGKFSGTSASAPIFAGLLALKISQNPNKEIVELISSLKKELNGR